MQNRKENTQRKKTARGKQHKRSLHPSERHRKTRHAPNTKNKEKADQMIITYTEHGKPFDFKRIDTTRKVHAIKAFEHGGLLYAYLDRYNLITIDKDCILSIEN